MIEFRKIKIHEKGVEHMAIVICPECNKKVSQYADACPNCGFPINKYMTEHNLSDVNKEFISTICPDHWFYGIFKDLTLLKYYQITTTDWALI